METYILGFSDHPHEYTYIETYVHACSLNCLATWPTCPCIAFHDMEVVMYTSVPYFDHMWKGKIQHMMSMSLSERK